jgi:DNA helicase-2/ATP-dependent DNA helicase PcrA
MVDCGTENLQSQFVAGQIEALHRQGMPLQEIAVLFRAGFHSFDLEIELTRLHIPFIKVGGFKFTESAHIKDMLAHLRVMVNLRDRISWYRMLLLIDKIGPKTAQRLYEVIAAENTVQEGLRAAGERNGKHESLKGLEELYAGMDARASAVAESGEAVLNYYLPILKERYDDHPKRLKDLEQLLTIMQRYGNLESFLIDMALEPPNTSADDNLSNGPADQDRLVLSTIHSAKGLEWDTVFIIWALDGRFPSIHALDDPDELEEELRLMYVAATRAKHNLFITYPSRVYERGVGLVYGRPSRFVDDMPHEILEKRMLSL